MAKSESTSVRTVALMVVLTFCCCAAVGQIKIQEITYQSNYSYGCVYHAFDLVVPLLDDGGDAPAVVAVVNDSMIALFEGRRSAFERPYYIAEEDCPTMYAGATEVGLSYSVVRNTADLLSIAVESRLAAGNGGHGGEQTPYCFVADVRSNKLITLDSLVSPSDKILLGLHIRHLAKEGFWEDEYGFFGDDSLNVFNESWRHGEATYNGMAISESGINLYFSSYWGYSLTYYETLTLPFTELSRFIKPEYEWICAGQ